MEFANKARTLELLAPRLSTAKILPQVRFTLAAWRSGGGDIRRVVGSDLPAWCGAAVIVRSSAAAEDSSEASLAGHFKSVGGIQGLSAINRAVEEVFASFADGNATNAVFVQPMLTGVAVSGVAFTRDPNNGGHYFVLNYDDRSGTTDSVTSGAHGGLRTLYCAKLAPRDQLTSWTGGVLDLLRELETLFSRDALDVEFAIDRGGQLYLLQVRPLVLRVQSGLSVDQHREVLLSVSQRVEELGRAHPYLRGTRSVFGVMPDWNPAEMIGVRPRPLALSLYKDLITDSTWAYQRDNYGYRNLRSFPLLVNLGGCPFIDVRVSFNSFVPSGISEELAHRLVEHYIQRLIDVPSHHDKVEFEIIYSCYTFDLHDRMQVLRDRGFTTQECEILTNSLRDLTNRIINGELGLWRGDLEKIEELKRRQDVVMNSDLPTLGKIYWLLEDCRRYGTLPFAGLARAAFIAVQILRSLVSVGVLTQTDFDGFMASLGTVNSDLCRDFATMTRSAFLEKYGHLRPGTYNILSPRYDEAPDRYFDWSNPPKGPAPTRRTFAFSLAVLNRTAALLKQHRIDHDVLSLFNFLKAAIEGREYSKFVFTKSLSNALQLLGQLGESAGLSLDDMSFADIGVVRQLYASSKDSEITLRQSIAEGRSAYAITQALTLPPLLTKGAEVMAFELPASDPNYVTQGTVAATVVTEDERANLAGNILMIPSADPGYDWIFSRQIAGFVTMYGGANSHMAIRAGELAIPAVVGAGERLYREWSSARVLELDCANRQVRVLS